MPQVVAPRRPALRICIFAVAWLCLQHGSRRRASAAETPQRGAVARRIAARGAGGEAGDAEAELYRLLAPRVRRYGLRHLRDAHAAADLMQHVMVHTIAQLRAGELREPERVSGLRARHLPAHA